MGVTVKSVEINCPNFKPSTLLLIPQPITAIFDPIFIILQFAWVVARGTISGTL